MRISAQQTLPDVPKFQERLSKSLDSIPEITEPCGKAKAVHSEPLETKPDTKQGNNKVITKTGPNVDQISSDARNERQTKQNRTKESQLDPLTQIKTQKDQEVSETDHPKLDVPEKNRMEGVDESNENKVLLGIFCALILFHVTLLLSQLKIRSFLGGNLSALILFHVTCYLVK